MTQFKSLPILFGILATAASAERTTFHALSDLPYSDDGKLLTHLLLYPEPCASVFARIAEPYAREFHGVGGEAMTAFFEGYAPPSSSEEASADNCPAICLERGVDQSVVTGVMPEYKFDPSGEENQEYSGMSQWMHGVCQRVEFGYVNYRNKENGLNVFWVDHKGNRVARAPLLYGERKTQFIGTFLGHRFVFEDPDTNEVVLDHVVEFCGILTIGRLGSQVDKSLDRTEEIRQTLEREWARHLKVKRTFSPLGFKKGRLPDDLWASMGAFYNNNVNSRSIEEWGGKGVFVNWWEVDVYMVQIAWQRRTVWQDRLRELVEAWTGIELENTDLYGMRRYERGARLLTHVDREATHAASLIVNIAQGNVTVPWTIEVHDHADRLHEVAMEPGDIVYYESAKCLHGRNAPLKGGYYVNLFAHYRPAGGDTQWYIRENPEGTPEPLIDIGECRLEGTIDQVSQGAVKCDNPAIGPYLSPTMFTAHNGEDLFHWWKSVAEAPVEVGEGSEEGCTDCENKIAPASPDAREEL